MNFVIDSIRNPAEVAELSRLSAFKLVGIECSAEVQFFTLHRCPEFKTRFQRMQSRNREGDFVTHQEFLDFEKRETSNDPGVSFPIPTRCYLHSRHNRFTRPLKKLVMLFVMTGKWTS